MTPYSLSELSEQIQQALQYNLEPTYWVCAEISSLSERGHCYMELVEKGDRGILSAKARATCWQSLWKQISAYFLAETGQPVQVGMQILVEVEVSFHPVYGLSLNIVDIDPKYTMGDLARQRQQTINQLDGEGLLDRQQQLVLPRLIRRIAVVSSDTAAGYQDFIHQLGQDGYALSAALFPAVMQGDGAESSILAALDAIGRVMDDFDVVVIIRGGGATTDLSCFDSYALCRACALFPLPVITGIGHTRDVSILDMVAFSALKTPTAVAAFFVERMAAEFQLLQDWRRRLAQSADRQILIRRHVLDMLRQRIESLNPERIFRQGYSLLRQDDRIIRSVKDVDAEKVLTTYLSDGHISSRVV